MPSAATRRSENAGENFLTKMQEVRYYVAFRIVKAAESLFSTVTCCSGCLAAYRRAPLMDALDVWLAQSFLGKQATFGDDRSLTNFMLRRWRVIYDSSAICSTIVPSTMRQFFKQQLRWKKSWIRESLLASMFMWRRHPLAAFYFYLGVVFPLVSPAVVFVALVLPLLGLGAFSYMYVYGTTLMALALRTRLPRAAQDEPLGLRPRVQHFPTCSFSSGRRITRSRP